MLLNYNNEGRYLYFFELNFRYDSDLCKNSLLIKNTHVACLLASLHYHPFLLLINETYSSYYVKFFMLFKMLI